MSSKHLTRRLLLQILLQNPFMNGQNGHLQSDGWLVAWLALINIHDAHLHWAKLISVVCIVAKQL